MDIRAGSESEVKRSELIVERFGELLFEAIDDTVRLVFGESASKLIYSFVERHVSLKREELGEKIEDFCCCLERLFGSEGAQIIQASSLKCLCLKLRREYEAIEGYVSFLDVLYEVKFRLLAPLLSEEHSACN